MQKSIPHIFCSALLLLCFVFCSAQENRISLLDPYGKSYTGVAVVFHSPFGLILPILKDSSGRYLIEGEIKRISATGADFEAFDTLFLNPLRGGDFAFYPIAISSYIDEVVVSANKDASRLKESNVSISLLKPYLIDNRITADATQILEQVPGVSIIDNQVNIRNGSGWSYGAGSRVMVTVDDLPMLSGDANAVQWTFLPLENIASVEIVKSAGSVLYGSSALNGTINFKTREAETKAQAQMNLFAGLYGNPRYPYLKYGNRSRTASGFNGFFSQKFKNTGLSFTWNGLLDEGFRMNEHTRKIRAGIKIKHNHAKIKGLNYGLSSSIQTARSGTFLLWESDRMGYVPLDSGFNFNTSFRLNVDPYLEYRGNRFSHKLMGRFLAVENKISTDKPDGNQSNGSTLYYTEYKTTGRVFPGFKLTLGAVAMAAETHSPLFGGRQQNRNLAAYIQGEHRFRRLISTVGARFENYRLNAFTQSKPVFRAGLNYALTRYTFLRASMGQGYRFPSMAEAYIKTTASGISIYPNPDLKPETGTNAEVGVKQGFKVGALRGFVDVSVFRILLENMMEFTFAQWGPPVLPSLGLGFKSVNVGRGRIQGFEIETAAEGKFSALDIKLLGGYTYTHPVSLSPNYVFAIDSAGSPLTFNNTRSDTTNILKYRYLHVFRFDIQCGWRAWESGISVRYNSRMGNIDNAFQLLVNGVAETRSLMGDNWIVDWRLARNFGKSFKLNFQVNNVFNTLYINRPADMRPPRSFQLQGVWKL